MSDRGAIEGVIYHHRRWIKLTQSTLLILKHRKFYPFKEDTFWKAISFPSCSFALKINSMTLLVSATINHKILSILFLSLLYQWVIQYPLHSAMCQHFPLHSFVSYRENLEVQPLTRQSPCVRFWLNIFIINTFYSYKSSYEFSLLYDSNEIQSG